MVARYADLIYKIFVQGEKMKKVIIIGAGPAGLTAGYELQKENNKDYEVIILEADNVVGGISKTVRYKDNRMDIGGHRFFSKSDEIMKFWEELMPIQGENSFDDEILGREKPLKEGGPNPEKEDQVMLVRTRVSRIYYLKKFFDYPISLKLQTFTNMGLIRTIKAGFSYMKSVFVKKEDDSLENFYINRFGKVLYSMFFEKYTEKLWGRHPREISADWGAQRVKGLSITAVIKDAFSKIFGGKKNKQKVETSLIEQFWYPKYGPGQLWEKLAEKVEEKGGKILKGYSVKKLNIENNKLKSVVCIVNGTEVILEGDIFISSMPVKDLVAGFTGQEVPEEMKNIAKGLPFVDFQTVGVLVKKLKLQNKTKIKTLGNIVPDCWVYVQEPEVKMLRFQIFNNWSPYMVKDAENTVWIGLEYTCQEGDKYWGMSDKDFSEFAINELASMNIIDKEDVLDSHRERVKKAYPAYFDTYEHMDKLIEYLNTFSNLYCVGRNGQHRYNNMDHSMATAMEAVKNIKAGIETKDNIWSVNTEKEYHEESKKEEDKK